MKDIPNSVLLEAMDSLTDGIAIFDADDRPLYVSPISRVRLGPTLKGLERGLSYRDSIFAVVRETRPDASESEVESIALRLYSAYADCGSVQVPMLDGRTSRLTFRPMSGGRRVAISVDVTELVQKERDAASARRDAEAARKQAEEASSAKSTFLANMSHEIRTPLNGVLGMAEVLAATKLDGEQTEFVETIRASGRTLMALLNDVLDLSKIEAGRFEIVPVDADLAHILARQVRLWEPRAAEKGLSLTLSIAPDLPPRLIFDPTRVQQCVANLVSNAIKFTRSGGVDIRVCRAPDDAVGDLLQIEVTDTGPGMAEDVLARLFSPFVQADSGIQRSHGGTGLGLSITRRLAQMMGGNASARSTPGVGSTFILTFRAKAASPAPPVASEGPEAPAAPVARVSGLRVLLVDDNAINRQIATLFLKPHRMHIVQAQNGQEALEALESAQFDIVLLDMHMPVLDGPATIKRIRESTAAWRDVRVISLTADAMSGDRERYLALGMDGYVSKPLSERELVGEISRVMARRPGGPGTEAAEAS